MRSAIALVLLGLLAFSNGNPVKPEADSLDDIVKDTKDFLALIESCLEGLAQQYKQRMENPEGLKAVDIQVLKAAVEVDEEVENKAKAAEKEVDVAFENGKDGLLKFFYQGIKELEKAEAVLKELRNALGLSEAGWKSVGWSLNVIEYSEREAIDMVRKLHRLM